MSLFYALGYKEWMKTRRMLGLSALCFVVVSVYSLIDLSHDIRLDRAVNVWYGVIFQNTSVAPLLAWLPSLVGLTVALTQFVPEITNKRLKLTLHLPANETSIMLNMLFYGFGVLSLLFVVFEAFLALALLYFLPSELVSLLIRQLIPWTAAGLSVYGFTAWVCIEPQWKQRIWNTVIGVTGISALYLSSLPGVYDHFGWGIVGLFVASFFFPLYSCTRFKNGIQ